MTPKAQFVKEQANKMNFVKTFCSTKDTVKRIKRQATTERKYLQSMHLIKHLYPKYIETQP